jgi:serine/threonine protein kinase
MPAERTIGNYVLGPLLGRGGMSEVRSATHRFLDDRVAIKLLRSTAGDADARAAFLAEATRTRAIDHPGVVRVIDVGCDGDDFYLVMELLDGETLATRLARGGRFDEATVRRLGAAIADGAAAAHARGIIHRDLKPGNIMLVGPGGEPKIVDFGIARQLDHLAARTTGSRTGTPAYMAPEQLTGGLIAPCVDIWALGAILYEALAGRLPFEGYVNGRCPQLFETPRRLADFATVSAPLDALIASCLDRDPARRPPSMTAIARALRGEAAEERITEEVGPAIEAPRVDAPRIDAPRVNAPTTAAPVTAPRRRIAIASLTTVVVLAGIAIAWSSRESPAQSAPAGTPSSTEPAPTSPEAVPASTEPAPTGARGSPPSSPDTAAADGYDPRPSGDKTAAAGSDSPSSDDDTLTEAPPEPRPRSWSTPFTVLVRSAPAGASIIVDGKRVGVTPASIALRAPAQVLVTRSGYQPSRVRAERAGPILVRLVPLPRARERRSSAGETLD